MKKILSAKKRKKMQELETLLKFLLQMGWKPWGIEYFVDVLVSGTITSFATAKGATSPGSLRELVSLESGLWQFCEKNGLLHEYYNGRSNIHPYKCYWTTTYEYRLIESALIPDEKLGKFLVDNIAIGGKKE